MRIRVDWRMLLGAAAACLVVGLMNGLIGWPFGHADGLLDALREGVVTGTAMFVLVLSWFVLVALAIAGWMSIGPLLARRRRRAMQLPALHTGRDRLPDPDRRPLWQTLLAVGLGYPLLIAIAGWTYLTTVHSLRAGTFTSAPFDLVWIACAFLATWGLVLIDLLKRHWPFRRRPKDPPRRIGRE
ncbi:MAG: hypothetical protein R3D33_17885 [Hyphomicrobiaceae bacterium]